MRVDSKSDAGASSIEEGAASSGTKADVNSSADATSNSSDGTAKPTKGLPAFVFMGR